VAWTRKDVRYAEDETALSAGVPPRGCAAGSLWPLGEGCRREPGLQRSVAAYWVKQDQLDRRERDDGLTTEEREELRKLRRENVRLKQEREILKRAAAFFAAETETR
jgi:hypothetical protein